MIRTTASPAPGRRPGGGAAAAARAALAAPFTRRARLELLFCLAGIPLGLCLLLVPYVISGPALAVALLSPEHDSTWVAAAAAIPAGLVLVLLATRIARRLGAVHRGLAARLSPLLQAGRSKRRGRPSRQTARPSLRKIRGSAT